ncbi:O-antigen polymerase [Aeromonas salmonicida]|uniref:O-antigen polymerase n=1 Tax=Aeromonas salmonicida TaxID=645 RepID=UPI000F77ED3F|nr:O-antigen polymerase [Aeromonas salmonicida]
MLNPFFIISISFCFSYFLYLLPFSNQYYQLDLTGLYPGLYFIFLNFIFGFLWFKLKLSTLAKIDMSSITVFSKKTNYLGCVVFFLILIELLLYGVPILGQVDYTEFGAPIIHVALVSSMLVLSIISSLLYSNNKNLKWWVFISLVISFLILNRFLILFVCVSTVFVYLSLSKIRARNIILVVLALIFFVYIFGLLGTWRMSNIMDVPYSQAQDYILTAGHASEQFKSTGLPVSVFWFWLYITSPISNFILNIYENQTGDIANIFSLISFELLPQTISKHLGDYPINVLLLSENLNVSSAITPVYVSLGYLGITIYALYYASIYFFVASSLRGVFRNVTVILLSTLSLFMIFFNVIIMPIFIFSLAVVVLISLNYSKLLRGTR